MALLPLLEVSLCFQLLTALGFLPFLFSHNQDFVSQVGMQRLHGVGAVTATPRAVEQDTQMEQMSLLG